MVRGDNMEVPHLPAQASFPIGVTEGLYLDLYRDNGKENGKYNDGAFFDNAPFWSPHLHMLSCPHPSQLCFVPGIEDPLSAFHKSELKDSHWGLRFRVQGSGMIVYEP